MRFSDLVGVDKRPEQATAAVRNTVTTDSYLNQLSDDPRNNGFVTGLIDRRRGTRMKASRRGFLRGSLAAAAATTAVSAASLFGPARKVEAQSGVVGTYPRRILQFCPPLNANDNCQPGCGSSPICTDCCSADGFFRNDPSNGYTLYAGGCGSGDIADGWLWRFSGKCGNCAEIEYRCSDGYVQTDTGPAPFICRAVTDCVPLAEGEEAGPALPDAARDTNWRPAGALEVAVDQGGAVAIQGWISDGSGTPVQMRITANNQIVHWGTAALARPDISVSRRGPSPNVGFGVSFPTEPGDYEFCVDALSGVLTATIGCVRLNVGSGQSVRGGGQTGSLPAPAAPDTTADTTAADTADDASNTTAVSPVPSEIVLPERSDNSASPTYGALQVVRRTGSTTGFVSGWAGDPDVDEPVIIDVLVDGASAVLARADLPRPDVTAAFASLHSATGFAISFEIPADATTVRVDAVSPDDGRRQPLGSQDLAPDTTEAPTEVDGRPTASGSTADASTVVYGGVDAMDITTDGVAITGWSFDPNDRNRQIDVMAEAAGNQVSGSTGLEHLAAQQIYGVDASCGFALTLELPAGLHDVIVSAMGTNGVATTIGRQTVAVA